MTGQYDGPLHLAPPGAADGILERIRRRGENILAEGDGVLASAGQIDNKMLELSDPQVIADYLVSAILRPLFEKMGWVAMRGRHVFEIQLMAAQVSTWTHEIRARCIVTAVQDRRVFVPVVPEWEVRSPRIMEKVEKAMPPETHKCEHCRGWTYNDRRGNCVACGAPRYTRD